MREIGSTVTFRVKKWSGLCVWLVSFVLLLLPVSAGATDDAERFFRARQDMVRTQLVARGIHDRATLRAMKQVPRHQFVPQDQRDDAYRDRPLPIGSGRTIPQPYIVAYMTQTIGPYPGQRVLEIGTGSGYQAAVLAETGARVYTIEIVPELARQAQANLARQGYLHIDSKTGDGYAGWPEQAPFDAILVRAAVEVIPPPLIRQLKDGGRMVIAVGSTAVNQMLTLVEKNGAQITSRRLFPTHFAPLRKSE